MTLTGCSAINRTTVGRNGAALLLGAGLIAGLQALSGPAAAGPGDAASAAMMNAEGEPVGTVELAQRENGTSVIVHLENLPEGTHAFHIHETGECEPPFKSAGGHYNPTMANHGFDSQAGPHVGDLPNIYVPASGALSFEMFNTRLEVGDSLLDNDGAAVVIHEGPDDYETDPAGAAGDRIACGVLKGPA
ncbi:MAG: superoxide dismutase family protein [Kiloniellaceae bacterium]